LPLGLGLDAGGTKTRWALTDATGATVAEGEVGGFSGLQLASAAGRAQIQALLADLATLCAPHGSVGAVCAGITGFDADAAPTMAALTGAELDVAMNQVLLFNDIELACHAAFAPGEGYLVYAGTGSVAAFIDAQGVLHRAGGHGVIIDDAGGGYWIAVQALRRIWRAEDEAPGAWQRSALARSVFEAIGGSDWALTRRAVYSASRGEVGHLALAVARAAAEDAAARAILEAAGVELARLARALISRHGARPVALAGRVFELHPSIEAALRRLLPTVELRPRSPLHVHQQAAQMAAAMAASAGHAPR
jgi:N-acetylglucosamine kinase-like BadF-type ATPase